MVFCSEILILLHNVRETFLRLIQMDFAEQKIIRRVVGKRRLVEHLTVHFKAGDAPIGPDKKPIAAAGESSAKARLTSESRYRPCCRMRRVLAFITMSRSR